MARDFLMGIPPDQRRYQARGLLPHGRAADREWSGLLSHYDDLLKRLQPFHEQPIEQRSVSCRLASEQLLSGEIGPCYGSSGLMHYSASRRIKSRALIGLWLQHLALCTASKLPAQERSQLLTASTTGVCFAPIEADKAGGLLGQYVDIYQQGLRRPLPVYPETSFAWANASEPDRALQSAASAWDGGDYENAPPGEKQDVSIRLALGDNPAPPWENARFAELADQIYSPAIEHGVDLD